MTDPDAPLFYLVTVRIDDDVADEWESWMRTVHIPDVVQTGCFARAWMCRQPSEDGASRGGSIRRAFRIIYLAKSRTDFERYEAQFAPGLQADHTTRYAEKFDASRSLCDVVGTFGN